MADFLHVRVAAWGRNREDTNNYVIQYYIVSYRRWVSLIYRIMNGIIMAIRPVNRTVSINRLYLRV